LKTLLASLKGEYKTTVQPFSSRFFSPLLKDENIITLAKKQKVDEAKRRGESCIKIFPRK